MFEDNSALVASLEDFCASSSDNIVLNLTELKVLDVAETIYVEVPNMDKNGYMDYMIR